MKLEDTIGKDKITDLDTVLLDTRFLQWSYYCVIFKTNTKNYSNISAEIWTWMACTKDVISS